MVQFFCVEKGAERSNLSHDQLFLLGCAFHPLTHVRKCQSNILLISIIDNENQLYL